MYKMQHYVQPTRYPEQTREGWVSEVQKMQQNIYTKITSGETQESRLHSNKNKENKERSEIQVQILREQIQMKN